MNLFLKFPLHCITCFQCGVHYYSTWRGRFNGACCFWAIIWMAVVELTAVSVPKLSDASVKIRTKGRLEVIIMPIVSYDKSSFTCALFHANLAIELNANRWHQARMKRFPLSSSRHFALSWAKRAAKNRRAGYRSGCCRCEDPNIGRCWEERSVAMKRI